MSKSADGPPLGAKDPSGGSDTHAVASVGSNSGTNSGMVIVGAGLAGLSVAEALRADGYEGVVTLLGDETCGPYHRPPLSKAFLLGEMQEQQ